MTAPEAPKLVTLAEAMDQLGVGKTRLYELINSGEIATVELPTPGGATARRRVGDPGPKKSRRIEQAEINAFIERNRARAPITQ
jgi:predicted DNA-binding transcriptional regulator AlpA